MGMKPFIITVLAVVVAVFVAGWLRTKFTKAPATVTP